jgi:hypothetical protein
LATGDDLRDIVEIAGAHFMLLEDFGNCRTHLTEHFNAF